MIKLMLAAVIEEIVFRGLIPRIALLRRGGRASAAILRASLLFAGLHLLNLLGGASVPAVCAQAALALGFGLWAGRAALRGGLPVAIAAHMGINLLSAAGLPLPALYIDPGTGSMLFAVLIGVLGVLRFALKGALVKLRFLLSGGQKVDAGADVLPLVIFSDDKRYWQTFEPVVRELDARGFDVTYMTASPDDPALSAALPHLRAEFIGEGNKAFAKLNFVKATMVLATTPGLEVYQWKRSKDVRRYIHLPHGANDSTGGYRSFGLDYYDTVLISGEYQEDVMRALEQLRNQPKKEAVMVGVPYMDEMVKRLQAAPPMPPHPRTVLVAPTWGASSIFSKYKASFIDALLSTGYHIILRPHPQSFTADKALMDELMRKYPDSEQLEWNRDADNFDVLRRSDIMISDYSGVIFDFAFVFDKPVICADTRMNVDPLDIWWLHQPLWAVTALPKIGPTLAEADIPRIKALIDSSIEDTRYAESRHEARDETWRCRGEGAARVADYLLEAYAALKNGKATQ